MLCVGKQTSLLLLLRAGAIGKNPTTGIKKHGAVETAEATTT